MSAHHGTRNAPIRRSLVESTAEAFRRAAAAPPAVPAVAAGAFGAVDIRRSLSTGLFPPESPQLAHRDDEGSAALNQRDRFDVSHLPAREFQHLVDAVVEAIEQRVVDELERRGRRHPGVF